MCPMGGHAFVGAGAWGWPNWGHLHHLQGLTTWISSASDGALPISFTRGLSSFQGTSTSEASLTSSAKGALTEDAGDHVLLVLADMPDLVAQAQALGFQLGLRLGPPRAKRILCRPAYGRQRPARRSSGNCSTMVRATLSPCLGRGEPVDRSTG